jgi:hypothetical protein
MILEEPELSVADGIGPEPDEDKQANQRPRKDCTTTKCFKRKGKTPYNINEQLPPCLTGKTKINE